MTDCMDSVADVKTLWLFHMQLYAQAGAPCPGASRLPGLGMAFMSTLSHEASQ